MLTTTVAEIGVLTVAQVKALWKCETLVLRHSHGVSALEAQRREGRSGEKWRAKGETRIDVTSQFSQWGERDGDVIENPQENASCFALLYNYEASVTQTALESMKAGDRIRIIWERDSNNGYVNQTVCYHYCCPSHDSRLHVDKVKIEIRRTVRNRIKTLVFDLETSVCADNTARMFRRA